uniref:Cytochrome P450 CYP82D47-like n=1 Tax=Opuntia streptacantha TaxID=393608 RepID=A0A7C9DUM1_OPUST
MEVDFHLPTKLSPIAGSIFTFLLFVYFLLRWKHQTNAKRRPPEPSGSWPLIGHLHLLGGLPHIALGKFADKYGPIFMIKLGVHRTLVISSPEMAKECLGSDKVFLDRPKTIFVELLGYDSAMMGFSPYGPYWREMRKIITLKLLSNQRVEISSHARASEVRSAIKAIHDDYRLKRESSGVLVDMKQWLSEINLNTTLRIIAGKSLKQLYQDEEYNKWRKALRDWFDLAGAFVPADALPFLRWLDIGGYEKSMKRIAKEIDRLPQRLLEEHKRKRAVGERKEEEDFVDVMLEIFEAEQDRFSGFDADTVIKATCMAMILGGTDTTAVTLIWALSLLLNNREALEKAKAELDAHVGKDRQVNESDLKNLVYLQAIIKETTRIYPATPLGVPRQAITDTTVSGYHIPASTRLFVNIYKMHRDPRVWPDPLEFRPERFLTTHKDYDVRGQNFELLPFGTGRRICPGISFALQGMQFTLANLLHGFEMSTPSGEKVDMTEGFGLTNLKASPLEIILVPRLPDRLYQ